MASSIEIKWTKSKLQSHKTQLFYAEDFKADRTLFVNVYIERFLISMDKLLINFEDIYLNLI